MNNKQKKKKRQGIHQKRKKIKQNFKNKLIRLIETKGRHCYFPSIPNSVTWANCHKCVLDCGKNTELNYRNAIELYAYRYGKDKLMEVLL